MLWVSDPTNDYKYRLKSLFLPLAVISQAWWTTPLISFPENWLMSDTLTLVHRIQLSNLMNVNKTFTNKIRFVFNRLAIILAVFIIYKEVIG